MKGYIINDKCYVFPQEVGQIPAVEADVIYVQEENFAAWLAANESVADKLEKYNYNVMTVKAKEWAGHTDDDLEEPVVNYNITYSDDGTYVTGPSTGAAGSTITITPVTADQFTDITLISSDATITKNTEDWTFTMPEADVAISVDYSHDYRSQYFTIKPEEGSGQVNGTLKNEWADVLECRKSSADSWQPVNGQIDIQANEQLQLRLASGQTAPAGGFEPKLFMNIYGEFSVEGNIMSLCLGDEFLTDDTELMQPSQFSQLFKDCTQLSSAENLILPATTLSDECYYEMFNGCTSLTTAPELPATTLAYQCYQNMFYGCTALETAPELSATTLAEGCYSGMFNGCTALETAPELSATTLAEGCYSDMFQGCTLLTATPELPATTLAYQCYQNMFNECTALETAPELPATTLADYCYASMFNNCTSLTTAPELPVATLTEGCYSGMFYGCTSLTTAPELPATTLAQRCYGDMFYGCTSLTAAPELPATTLADMCYTGMFGGCTSLTTAPELPATTLATQCYMNMFGGCTSLNYIKCLATDISATSCTFGWVNNVSSTGTFIKPASANWSSKTGTDGIPSGWTVEDAAA